MEDVVQRQESQHVMLQPHVRYKTMAVADVRVCIGNQLLAKPHYQSMHERGITRREPVQCGMQEQHDIHTSALFSSTFRAPTE